MQDNPNFNVNDESTAFMGFCGDPFDTTCQTRVIVRLPATIINQSEIPIYDVVETAITASYALTASYVSGAASSWDTISGKPSGLISSSAQATLWTVATSSIAENANTLDGFDSSMFAVTASNIFTGQQTIATSPSSESALIVSGTVSLQQALEKHSISASAPLSVTHADVLSQALTYYTSDTNTNWTLNFRGNDQILLNNCMYIGQSITVVTLVTNGITPHYATTHSVDGNIVVPKWQGGYPPTEGIPNSIEAYSYSLIKIADSTFTILASKNQFS